MPVAIADTSSAAASLLNGLNAAANQHAQILRQQQLDQQAQAQREFENAMQMHTAGAIPADTETKRDDGFVVRQPNPAASGAGQTVRDPQSGKSYYLPTASEKEEAGLNDTNSFVPQGQLGAMLEAAGHKPGARIKAADSHSLLQAINEAQPKDEPWDLDTSGKFLDTEGKPTPVLIGKKSQTVRPLKLAGTGGFALPEKADRPDAQSIIPGEEGPNGGKLVFNKNTQTIDEVAVPKGSKHVMTAGQQETEQRFRERQQDRADARTTREEDRQQKGRDDAQKVIDALNTREQEQHARRGMLGTILGQPNSKSKEASGKRVTVIDPDKKEEVELTPARRAYYQDQYNKATDLATAYSQQSKKLIVRHGGDTGATPAKPSQPKPSAKSDPLGIR